MATRWGGRVAFLYGCRFKQCRGTQSLPSAKSHNFGGKKLTCYFFQLGGCQYSHFTHSHTKKNWYYFTYIQTFFQTSDIFGGQYNSDSVGSLLNGGVY